MLATCGTLPFPRTGAPRNAVPRCCFSPTRDLHLLGQATPKMRRNGEPRTLERGRYRALLIGGPDFDTRVPGVVYMADPGRSFGNTWGRQRCIAVTLTATEALAISVALRAATGSPFASSARMPRRRRWRPYVLMYVVARNHWRRAYAAPRQPIPMRTTAGSRCYAPPPTAWAAWICSPRAMVKLNRSGR